MLIKKIEAGSDGLFDAMRLERGSDTTPLASVKAANADDFHHGRMQARRLRRQNRHSRLGANRVGGWAIRAW